MTLHRVTTIKNDVMYGGQLSLNMEDHNDVTLIFTSSSFMLNSAHDDGGVAYVVAEGMRNRVSSILCEWGTFCSFYANL